MLSTDTPAMAVLLVSVVRNLRSGRKKACGAVKQKKDDEVKSSLVDALSHQKPCRQKSADFDRRSQGGSFEPSFALKLFIEAQAATWVPSTAWAL